MPPFLLLSSVLGAMYGTLFHLWRGDQIRDLLIYLVAGILGFLVGQGIGNLLGFEAFLIGPIHVIEATIVSWSTLFLAWWLKL